MREQLTPFLMFEPQSSVPSSPEEPLVIDQSESEPIRMSRLYDM